MTIRATIAEPVEPTIENVFGAPRHDICTASDRIFGFCHDIRITKRPRIEWRLIQIGLRGKVLRVLVVYLNRKAAA